MTMTGVGWGPGPRDGLMTGLAELGVEKLPAALKAARAGKPVVAFKIGRSEAGAKASIHRPMNGAGEGPLRIAR